MIEVIYNSTPDKPDHSGVVRVYLRNTELTEEPTEYLFNSLSVSGNYLVLQDKFGRAIKIIKFAFHDPIFRFNDGLEDLP